MLPKSPPIKPPYVKSGILGIDAIKILAPPKHPTVIAIKFGTSRGINEAIIFTNGVDRSPNPDHPITYKAVLNIPFLVLICSYPSYSSTKMCGLI